MDKNKIIAKILNYYYRENLTQQAIASKLNISRIKVVRYIKYAKKNNFIDFKINIPNEEIVELENLIENKFNLRECRIISSLNKDINFFKNAGLELSEILERILKKNTYVGVNWSFTIKNILENMDTVKKIIINVVPLIGGLEISESTSNANVVAYILANKFGGNAFSINLPAVLDNKKAKKMIEKEKQTKEIKIFADKVSVAIIGIGNIGVHSTAFKTGYFSKDEIDYLTLHGVHGTINLNFIDKNGQEVKTNLDNRIMNILPFERFKNIKNIIAIAYGDEKVKAIKAALTGKFIHYFITDENTGRLLIKKY